MPWSVREAGRSTARTHDSYWSVLRPCARPNWPRSEPHSSRKCLAQVSLDQHTPYRVAHLRNHAADRFGWNDAGEFLVQPTVEICQVVVLESHQVQNRRVKIAHVVAVDDRGVADFVRFAVAASTFDPAAREPISESLGVMFTTSVLAL